MYQLLLTRRYLTSKVMPLLAALAVMLCSAMVLIVWSVMGGFLTTLVNSGRTLTGDVAILWPNTGFAHYEDLIQRLERHHLVEAATPVVESFGMMALPNGQTRSVVIRGIDGPSFAQVTRWADILWWRPIEQPLPKDKDREDPRLGPLGGTTWAQVLTNGLTLTRPDPRTGAPEPAAVLGIEATDYAARLETGVYIPLRTRKPRPDGTIATEDVILWREGSITLTVPVLDSSGKPVEPASVILPVANEFQSGVYEFDAQFVMVPLATLQRLLRMDAGLRVVGTRETNAAPPPANQNPGQEGFAGVTPDQLRTEPEPARVTTVLVRGRADAATTQALEELASAVREIYGQFAAAHQGQVPDEFDIRILTWEDQNRTMINAVRKEIGLLLFLFGMISFVAVFLILAIFYSMVSEKTKDIGVLRAVGASAMGIAGLWVLYGLALGLAGATAGVALAHVIVWNINPIHEWLGRALGLVIWDPRVYYFTEIPRQVEPARAVMVWIAGLVSAVLGALYPAARAALMRPVQALRFE